MSAEGFGSIKVAAGLRDVVTTIVRKEIDVQRPRGRAAVVVGLDPENHRVSVRFADEPDGDPVNAAMPVGIEPTLEGQYVRVEGQPGARYVAAILGGSAALSQTIDVPGVVMNDNSPPAMPTDVVTYEGVRAFTVLWSANTEIDMINAHGSYEVQVAQDEAMTVDSQLYITSTPALYVPVEDAATDGTRWVRVRAVDFHGDTSPWTDPIEGTATLITNIDIEDGSVGEAKLAFGAVGTDNIKDMAVVVTKFKSDRHFIY